ncbi:dsDNA-binding protein [Pectobacterium phage POP12]|nr:dsDNA-binding protein [Pectobacterium phage POP12]
MSKEFLELNPDSAKAVKELIVEASNALTRKELESGNVSGCRTRAKTDFGMSGKQFNTMLKLYHNQARDEFETTNDEVVETYDMIFKANS